MNEKDRRITGLLSFLLPGLGQVYAGKYLRGILFFLPFAGALAFSTVRLGVPLVAIGAAWDAFRLKPREAGSEPAGDPTWRKFVFFAGGFLAFFGWVVLFGSDISPFGVQTRMQARIDPLVEEIEQYKAKHGSYPKDLLEMVTDRPTDVSGKESIRTDIWGHPFDYRILSDGFEIRSVGRDGKPDTDDDFIYSFR